MTGFPRRRHSTYKGGCSLALTLLLSQLILAGGAGQAIAAKKHPAQPVASEPVRPVVTPYIVVDYASGRVIEERISTHVWYPASVTKLMTAYVALQAVRQGRLKLDTPLVVSARATRMKPSKMGFTPGTQVTLDNALKMLMVKSANDIAVTIAEGVSGSVEAFAEEMNQTAAELGMRESHFVNPNGLPDPNHVSSARDMALLGRALLARFPENADLFSIGAFRLGDNIVPTHNGLIGRYPGADGMKTGFTCSAGFNVVASATRDGRRVIVVVLGDRSAKKRTAHAADLFDRAFASSQYGYSASELNSIGGAPPDMKSQVCGKRSRAEMLAAETEDLNAPIQADDGSAPTPGNGALIAALPRPIYDPIPVFVGATPGYRGPVAGPRPAHAPIGAIAYAPAEKSAAPTALKPDPDAQSMRRVAKAKPKAKVEAKNAVEHGGDKAKQSEAKNKTSAKVATGSKDSAKPVPVARPKAKADAE